MRWYVLRAEQYLKAFPGKRVAEHSKEDVTGYLERVGRIDRIADWQFVQIVDAVQSLLATAGAAVSDQVDWAYWRDSAQTLASNHPTIAREGAAARDEPVSSARFKDKRNPRSALDAVRKDHGQLLERLAAEIRRRKYSIRTEQVYESWACRFILFCGNGDPAAVGTDRIVAFLEDLAVRGQVSASTQNQALNALVFLYRQVLGRPLDELGDFTRAKRPKRLPVVLERAEVVRLLGGLDGTRHLMAALLYGTGMRLMECVRLRVQDVDFHYHQILVRDGKGQKDRVVPLPKRLEQPLHAQLEKAGRCTSRTWTRGTARFFSPMHWPASGPMPRGNGFGSMSFRAAGYRWIRAAVRHAGII